MVNHINEINSGRRVSSRQDHAMGNLTVSQDFLYVPRERISLLFDEGVYKGEPL